MRVVHVPALGDEPDRTVPASGVILRLTVTVLAGRTVVLSALRPVVLERHRPRGHLMPHAGVVSPRRHTVLLDPDPPRLEPRYDDRRPFSYKVSPDDPEVCHPPAVRPAPPHPTTASGSPPACSD
ncbi:hypothetical protein [Streptomyces sediminimaris]|uniref:hypothetical protein n=1 Tax=Streptomyces sediminimaris TaxID=3383721 RepID=UPI00399B62CE